MRTKTLIALPVAAGLALGGASLATADDPPKQPRPAKAPVTRMVRPALPPFLQHGPFGLDAELAADMAKELGLPEERVAAAMKKAIGARFDRRGDRALECFDDKRKCAADELPFRVAPFELPPNTRPKPVNP